MRALLLAGVVSVGVIGSAQADTLIFNGLGTNQPFNTLRAAGSAPLGVVTFSAATSISAFGVYDAMSGPGTQTFLIFNFDTGALLYQSAAKSFVGDGGTTIGLDSYKVSDPLSFTFQPGINYDIGATASVSTGYYAALDAVTQNGITVHTNPGNDNVSGTTIFRVQQCCSTGIELFVPSVATAVPEPASLGLLGMGVAGIAAVRRRRRRAS